MTLYLGTTPIAGGIEGNQLNNPFSLLDYKFSEYEISNASWLRSNGQFNSGEVYSSIYNLLQGIYNGTVTKAGVSVKLSTGTYADTDFVLNTSDTTFRLPLKVALASGKAVVGNGMTLGITDGTINMGTAQNASSSYYMQAFTSSYGNDVGVSAGGTGVSSNKTVGITTDPTKSGIETSANGLYLYFYVGETVQNANLINAGQVLNDIANLKNGIGYSNTGKETISGWSMPSSRYIDLTLLATGSTYTAPANGWLYIAKAAGTTSNVYVSIESYKGSVRCVNGGLNVRLYALLPMTKGSSAAVFYNATGTTNYFRFIYAEGENV